jgi:hypothetical protein
MPRLSELTLPAIESFSSYTQFSLSIATGGHERKMVSRAFHLPHQVFAVYESHLFYPVDDEPRKSKTVTYETLENWIADALAMTKKDLIFNMSIPGSQPLIITY